MKTRRFISFLAVAVMSWGSLGTVHAEESAEKAAQLAAKSWLDLVDSGKYSESWEAAAELFKQQVTKQQWENALQSVRTPLGKLELRKLKSADYTKTLPGAPDGEYVVIQYETAFEKKKSAIETVTPMKDKDRQWRVSGYFIK